MGVGRIVSLFDADQGLSLACVLNVKVDLLAPRANDEKPGQIFLSGVFAGQTTKMTINL